MTEEDFYLEDLRSKFRKLKNVGGYDKYYLSYSGGKDSHFLYWFIKEYSYPEFKDIKIVGVNTYMEHHEILQRILKNCDEVLLPELKPFEIKEKYGSPCFSKAQDYYISLYQKGYRSEALNKRIYPTKFVGKDGKEHNSRFVLNNTARKLLLSGELHKVSNKCCYYLKKKTAHDFEKRTGLKAILGIRGSESIVRKAQYKSCFTKDHRFTPIYDLSDELMEKIIKKYNIEVPEVYKYINRTGCMGCPYGSRSGNTEKELALISENQKKFVCSYFKESYEVLGINTKVQKQTTIEDFIND